jgi:hypothetical protein
VPRRVPLPPALREVAFTVAAGTEAGLSKSRLRSPDLIAPFRGVRSSSEASSIVERCRQYASRMPSTQFFSRQTAAAVFSIPLPWRFSRVGPLHVSAFEPEQEPRMRGVAGHTVQPGRATVVVEQGLRVTSPVDTWCELSTVLTVDELVVAGDRLLARQNPLCTMQELRSAVAAFAGRRGVRKLRAALVDIRAGVDSPKETEVRLLLVRGGLPEPQINGVIRNRYGAQIAIGDMVYPEFRTLVEYDGQQHRTDDRQYQTDSDRVQEIMDENWRVIRVLKDQLRFRPATVLSRVRSALIAGGWSPETAVSAAKR